MGVGHDTETLTYKDKKMIEDLIQSQAIGTRKKRHKNPRHTEQLEAKRTETVKTEGSAEAKKVKGCIHG